METELPLKIASASERRAAKLDADGGVHPADAPEPNTDTGYSSDERRRDPRIAVNASILLKPLAAIGTSIHGTVVDISRHGIRVRLDELPAGLPKTGDAYRVRSDDDDVILCEVRSVRLEGAFTDIGFAILHWSSIGELNRLLESCQDDACQDEDATDKPRADWQRQNRRKESAPKRILTAVAGIGIGIAIGVAVTLLSISMRARAAGPPPVASTQESSHPAPVPPRAEVASAVPAVPVSAPLAQRVSMKATAQSWVSGCIDGKPVAGKLLSPGEEQTIEFERIAIFRLGNAGGVEVSLDSKPLGVLGPMGAPRVVEMRPEGVRLLPPTVGSTNVCEEAGPLVK
jgi:hypothetical protein